MTTKAQRTTVLLEQGERDHTVAFLASRAYSDLRAGMKPDATETYREHKGPATYQLDLFRSTGAQGGYLVITFRHPGQGDSYQFTWFEDHQRIVRNMGFTEDSNLLKGAMSRLDMARHQANAA